MPEDNIPKTVERYVDEHKKQDMDEDKAWAIAWSRYCSKHEDSPHCNKDEYFEGKPEIADGIKNSQHKHALRGDYSSGRGELMNRWDLFQQKKGFEPALDELMDWLGGKKVVKYLKHVTRSHSRDYDMSEEDYKSLAREIVRKSRLGFNQLGDAFVKAMSVDELEDMLEDFGYSFDAGEIEPEEIPERPDNLEHLPPLRKMTIHASPDQLYRLADDNPESRDKLIEACKRQLVKNAMATAPKEDLRKVEDLMRGRGEAIRKGPGADAEGKKIYSQVADMMKNWKNGHFAEQIGPWYYAIEGVKKGDGTYVGTFRAMNTRDGDKEDKVGVIHKMAK
jgi:hypothetical protein